MFEVVLRHASFVERAIMKKPFQFVLNTLGSGLLVVIPIYLAVLLILKAAASVAGLVRPLSQLVPDWVPAERILSLLLVLTICFLIGVALHTRRGRVTRDVIEKTIFERIPGYATIRGLTHRMAGDESETVWRPAFAEIEEALVPAFIIEEFEDGRYTVFVPSVPTPFAGAVYILEGKRVHPLNIPLTQALQVISKWGSGARDLVTAAEKHRSQ
jgi:uncharacterized membrane protein